MLQWKFSPFGTLKSENFSSVTVKSLIDGTSTSVNDDTNKKLLIIKFYLICLLCLASLIIFCWKCEPNCYDNDQIQTLKLLEKISYFPYFVSNLVLYFASPLKKNFDNAENLLKCTNKVFNIVVISKLRVTFPT